MFFLKILEISKNPCAFPSIMHPDELIASLGKEKKSVSAGFFRRLMGFVADILMLDLVVYSAFSGVINKYVENFSLSSGIQGGIPHGLYLLLLLLGVFSFVYFTLFEYAIGKTPGMMLVGIKVDENPDKEISFWKCAARNIFVIPAFPFTLFWIIEPLYLAVKKRRLLEQLTGTNTVLEN
jgi:uncharacterized RDD family membrane protein YckC